MNFVIIFETVIVPLLLIFKARRRKTRWSEALANFVSDCRSENSPINNMAMGVGRREIFLLNGYTRRDLSERKCEKNIHSFTDCYQLTAKQHKAEQWPVCGGNEQSKNS